MNKFRVILSNHGQDLTYLHTEAIDLSGFGRKNVTRASEVEFDHANQEWVATLNDGREIARDRSRDVVLQREREVIEEMLLRWEPIP